MCIICEVYVYLVRKCKEITTTKKRKKLSGATHPLIPKPESFRARTGGAFPDPITSFAHQIWDGPWAYERRMGSQGESGENNPLFPAVRGSGDPIPCCKWPFMTCEWR